MPTSIDEIMKSVDSKADRRTRPSDGSREFPDEMLVEEIRFLRLQLQSRDAELLRIRTTQQAAAHELDNIAIEAGLGHSPKAGVVADYVRKLRNGSDNPFLRTVMDLQEAVRVLAEESATWRENNLKRMVGRDDVRKATNANLIASAAVDAAKGRGG